MATLLVFEPARSFRAARPAGRPCWAPWPALAHLEGHVRQAQNQPRPPAHRSVPSGDRPGCGHRPGSFTASLDAAGCRPDDLHVHLSDGVIMVRARRRSETGRVTGGWVSRVRLPDTAQAGGLTARLTPAGQLVLQAPLTSQQQPVTSQGQRVQPATSESARKTVGEDVQANRSAAVEVKHPPAQAVPEKSGPQQTTISSDDVTQLATDQPPAEETIVSSDDVTPPASSQSRTKKVVSFSDDITVSSADQSAQKKTSPTSPSDVTSPPADQSASQNTYRVSVDVSAFQPEEVTVRVGDGVVTVQAVHEESSEDGSCSRQLMRQFQLPSAVDPDLLTSRLSRAGQLVVEGPLGRGAERLVDVERDEAVVSVRDLAK